ncbi:hypothetical protein HK096_003872 [Nowakowskiella sp. JEL0078]|nr:hypothetical protein HK096_003872 [Nowakowskiella sp. JEL0078]
MNSHVTARNVERRNEAMKLWSSKKITTIENNSDVHVVFLLDVSGSMSAQIAAMKSMIQDFCKIERKGVQVRVFTFSEEPSGCYVARSPKNSSATELIAWVGKISLGMCEGKSASGGDGPENQTAALFSLTEEYTSSDNVLCFLISDAGPHHIANGMSSEAQQERDWLVRHNSPTTDIFGVLNYVIETLNVTIVPILYFTAYNSYWYQQAALTTNGMILTPKSNGSASLARGLVSVMEALQQVSLSKGIELSTSEKLADASEGFNFAELPDPVSFTPRKLDRGNHQNNLTNIVTDRERVEDAFISLMETTCDRFSDKKIKRSSTTMRSMAIRPKIPDMIPEIAPAAESSSSLTEPKKIRKNEVKEPLKLLSNTKVSTKKMMNILSRVPTEVWLEIAEWLPAATIPLVGQAISFFKVAVHEYNVLTKREICCFYDRSTHVETVLGFGVQVEIDGSQKFMISEFDYLSVEAFEKKTIRQSVWKKPFTFFIPFAICNNHFQRALPHLRASIYKLGMSVLVPKYIKQKDLDRPNVGLQLIVRFMNNIVVSLFRISESKNTKQHVLVAASEKAVQGYVSLIHLALSLIKRFPVLKEEIEERVEHFIRFKDARNKSETPDIGEFLIYLGLSNIYNWSSVTAKALIPQFLARNVLWFLRNQNDPKPQTFSKITSKDYPYLHLAYMEESNVSEIRLTDTYKATKTSTGLLLFQVFFLTKIMRPTESTTRETIYLSLEKSLGRPPAGMLKSTFLAIKKIQTIKNYGSFFNLIGAGYEGVSKETVCKLLKQAILDSEQFGYHKLPKNATYNVLLKLRQEKTRDT